MIAKIVKYRPIYFRSFGCESMYRVVIIFIYLYSSFMDVQTVKYAYVLPFFVNYEA
jgi:hypothetical protein